MAADFDHNDQKNKSHRNRRKRAVRSKTIYPARFSRAERHLGLTLFPESVSPDEERPQKRGDCASGPRPCPFVSCRHHLYLDIGSQGSIKLNFPDLEVDELPETGSCALDVADAGGATLEEAAAFLNVTRERVRQIALGALKRLGAPLAHLRHLL